METNGLNTSSSGPHAAASPLRAGARLQATVTADLGQQRYSLSLAGREVEIESPQPLQTGQKLTVQVVRQENGALGLQVLRDTLQGENASAHTRDTGAAAAAGATARTSRPAEATLQADALRALLPHNASAAEPSASSTATNADDQPAPAAGSAPTPSATAPNTAASSTATSDPSAAAEDAQDAQDAQDARASAEQAASITASKTAAGSAAAGSAGYAGLVLRVVTDAAGSATLLGPAGTPVAATILLTTATATQPAGALLQATAQPLLRIQDIALQLLIGATSPAPSAGATAPATIPATDLAELFPSLMTPATAAQAPHPANAAEPSAPASTPLMARLSLTPQLLQALPSPLAGVVLTLQPILENSGAAGASFTTATASAPTPAGMTLYSVSHAGTQLPATLALPAVLAADAISSATVQPEAIIQGTLQTSRCTPELTAPRNQLEAGLLAAGLTPGTSTREAAQALTDQDVPLSRGNVQTLLALAAGRTGDERAAFLQAGARLLALDAPVAPALAAGMANLHNAATSLAAQSASVSAALSAAAAALPGASVTGVALQDAARLTGSLAVMVGADDTPQALSGFVSTLGREVLAGAQAAVESAAAGQLATSSVLPRLDAALEVVLARLSNLPAESGAQTPPQPGTAAQAPALPAAGQPAQSTPAATSAQPAAPVVTTPASVSEPTAAGSAELAQRLRLALTLFTQSGFTAAAGAHPGVQDFPDYARPVDPSALSGQSGLADRDRLDTILNNLSRAGSPEETARTAREAMRGIDAHTLRELAAVLQQAERSEIDQLPGLRELRDASDALRDLGRTFLAQKAENLAAQEPLVWSGSVPLRFGNDSKDGQLQMFYRKGGKEGKDWTQRVMLDLDMSAIGTVVGDLKFLKGQLTLALLSPDAQTVRWLESGSEELAAGLEDAGFPCAPAFRVLPPKAAGATGDQEEPAPRATPGRLDVRA